MTRLLLTGGLAVVLVALLSAPSFAPTTATIPPSAALVSGSASVTSAAPVDPAVLTINSAGYDLSPTLWGTTVTPRAFILPQEGLMVNATPAQLVVWPGASGGEAFNPLTNQIFTLGSKQVATASTSEAQFVAWCRSINCTAIFQVPGEIDNPTLAASIVSYTETTLGFHPAYWEIGNEPETWTAWQVPWTQWPTDKSTKRATPSQYAWEVNAYSLAMRAVDPNIHLVGVPVSSRPQVDEPAPSAWVTNVTKIDGPNISAEAVHVYPSRGNYQGSATTLATYYSALNGTSGLVDHVLAMRETIKSESQNISCVPCANVPVLVTEVGTALSHFTNAVYAQTFPGGLASAAEAVQAIDLNLTTLDVYAAIANTSNSWISLTGVARPEYTVYADLLSHLGNVGYPAALDVSHQLDLGNMSLGANLYAVATVDPGNANRADLLVVNLNTTTGVTFAPSLPGISSGAAAEAWQWSGVVSSAPTHAVVTATTPAPAAESLPAGLPSTWTLPPQSVAVFEAYPDAGAPVVFNETGLSGSTRWFLSVNGTVRVSSVTSSQNPGIALFLPTGQYDVQYIPVPFPVGVKVPSTTEQIGGFGPSRVAVANLPTNYTVRFVHQWSLDVSAVPSYGGKVTPTPAWGNFSAPIELTARPSPGYAFSHWVGYGPGSSNNTTTPSVVIWANGSISEKAVFVQAFSVTFAESGLPPGTNWSVALRGISNSSVRTTMSFFEANGSYGYSVAPVPGYGLNWTSDLVQVTGGPVLVRLSFHLLPPFRVTFVETGLASGTAWSVTVRGFTQSSHGTSIAFEENVGTSGFSVGKLQWYRSTPAAGSFTVNWGPLTIPITFIALPRPPLQYNVTFVETGLPSGAPWTLTVRNVTATSTTDLAQLPEKNGSYGYHAVGPDKYRAIPGHGFTVDGTTGEVAIRFVLVAYEVVWKATGITSLLAWSVNISGDNIPANGSWTTAMLANGTYHFAVTASPGFVPQPRYGTLALDGDGTVLSITFFQVEFPVGFAGLGVSPNSTWRVRFSNVSGASLAGVASFTRPNGTYTFDVTPPAGFYAVPSHGNVTVGGDGSLVPILFVPIGPGPRPSLWALAEPALVAAVALGLSAGGMLVLLSFAGRRRKGRGGNPEVPAHPSERDRKGPNDGAGAEP